MSRTSFRRSFFDDVDTHFEARADRFECEAQRSDDGTWRCPIAGTDHCDFECYYRMERLG